ncbi:hypothetical protein DaDZ19_21640 [Dickeya ananatis]
MNKSHTPLLAIALSLLSLTASAADGYKNLKFGSSAATIRQQANCSLRGPETIMGQTVYICPDFSFADKKTQAIFSFNNDKFNRMAISITMADLPSVIEGLKKQIRHDGTAVRQRCGYLHEQAQYPRHGPVRQEHYYAGVRQRYR